MVTDGALDGCVESEGDTDSFTEGAPVEGASLGEPLGTFVGMIDGACDEGASLGTGVGTIVGETDGA